MDAAQTNFKKIVFFLATALLLTAPFQASAQALVLGNTAIVIGSSACNDSQVVTIASSSTVQFTVAINYTDNLNGDWLYANFGTNATNFGSTSSSAPITAHTGPNGVQLTIGLNRGVGSATPVAYVQLTPAGGATQTITVNYTQNTSCGGNTGSVSNGFFNVTPGNIAISSSSPSQTVTIQNTVGTGFTFTPTVSPANTWLTVTYSSTSVSANGSTAITVTGIASETSGVGTYNGILTITPNQSGVGGALNVPVVFTVSNGSGGGNPTSGTLTVNSSNSNTATISLAYVLPYPPSECVNLVDTASDATSYSWSVSTNGSGNWLYANNTFSGATPQNLAANYGACIEISLNTGIAANLANGAYQGAVVVTSSSGASATINVNLYISGGVANGVTVSAQGQQGSGAIYAFPNVASNSSIVQQETFTVSANSGYVLGSPSMATAGGDFTMNTPTVNNNSVTFTVTSNSTGLVTGLYSATITVPVSFNGVAANTYITVVQPVGQAGTTATGGGTTTTNVQPTSLSFQQQYGNSFWTSGEEKQTLAISGAQGGQWSATVVYAAGASGWLAFDPAGSGTFGNGPASLQVDLFNASSLSPSTTPYQATIDITSASGLSQIAVSLLVTPSNTPVLLGLPALTTFSITSGASTNSQLVTIVGSDNTLSTSSPPITAGAPTATWLSATTSGNTLTLSINNTAQTTGVYSATVPITASAYSNAINYPVVLIVNGGGGGSQTGGSGPLTLSSTALSYSNVTASITQDLNVSASTSTTFTLTAAETNCTTANWLSVAIGTYVVSTNTTMIPVTVSPSGIANGTTCNGVLTLVSTAGGSGTQTVSVSMTVASSSGTGNVTVTPSTMTFAYTQTQSLPAAQTATVVNATSGTASIPFTVGITETNGNSVTWLKANVTSASTPYNTLSISVAPGSLPAATYTGTVTITPNGGSAQTIGVTMTVSANLTVTASPTAINLTYTAGGTAPTATIQVTGGGATADFTAAAASTGGWLQVTPTSGTTPNTGTSNLTVSTVASALASLLPSATPYTGTITVTGTSPATGTTMINVSLAVSAPLPVISSVINAASGAGGTSNVTVSPGEIISLFAPTNGQSPIGPATAVPLSATTCPSPCTSVPTSMGGVTVTFLPGGYLAPLLYVGAGQINTVVPYEVGVAKISNLSVEVKFLGQSSNAFPLTLASTAPGIFTYPSSQQAAVYQYDPKGNGSYNNASTPATAGWTIVLYVTGEGGLIPPATTGSVTVAASTPPYTPTPAAGAPTVLFNNNTPATLSFYGEAPTFVSGLMQLNVVVPAGAGTGAVPVTVTIGGNSTQAGVTVYLQ